MNSLIKILVADDHPMLLNGLINELSLLNYDVLPGAANGAQALELITTHEPDVAILDIEMPLLTGFEVIKKCQEKSLKTRFIILTSYKEKIFVLKAKKFNISGYLLKDEPFSEINKGIQSALKGVFYSSQVFDDVFSNEITPQLEKVKFLSPSERTIVRLIAQEKTSKEIGELLFISPRTVQKHRSNIILKLDLPSDANALSDWVQQNKDIFLML